MKTFLCLLLFAFSVKAGTLFDPNLALGIVAATGGGGTPAFVQEADGTGFDHTSQAYGSSVTAGNILVVFFVAELNETPAQTISDTIGNSWTLVASTNDFTGNEVATTRAWVCKTSSSGANTVTVSSTIASCKLIVMEFSGISAGTLDGASCITDKSGFPTSLTSGNVVTSASGVVISLIQGVRTEFTGSNPVADSGYTRDQRTVYTAMQWKATTASTYTPAWTFNNCRSPVMISFGVK